MNLADLPNDQLADLAKAVQHEISQRNPAAATAAVSQASAAVWSRKRALSRHVRATMRGVHLNYKQQDRTWTIAVLRSRAGEVAVNIYDDAFGFGTKKRAANEAWLYVTGDDAHPPGTLDAGFGLRGREEAIRQLMAEAAAEWATLELKCDLE